MSGDDKTLKPGEMTEVALDDALAAVFERAMGLQLGAPGSTKWEPAFDLRVNRPRAIDLRKLWTLTNTPVPPAIAAVLGPSVPILLDHVITPFPAGGNAPGGVWGLGYEIALDGVDANTISVVPNDVVVNIGRIDQEVQLGVELGGEVGIPDGVLATIPQAVATLSRGNISASTNQRFQFALRMQLSLRKVVGAPVGAGGAMWKLYRQDEPIDRPHTLLQTLVVAPGTSSLPCTVKTWAKQAGFLGMRLGAKYWEYPDQHFEISLDGLD